MAFSIALTLGQRDNLLTLQAVERNQARTQGRLASGREVNDVVDDVFRYFAARALTDRASDFLEYRQQIEQGITALTTAVDTIESITKLFNQIKGVVQASNGREQTALVRLGSTLQPTLKQIGNLVIDAHYQGVNQIVGDGKGGNNDQALTVRFSEKHTLSIASLDVFSAAAKSNPGSALVNTDYASNKRFISYNASLTEAKVSLEFLLRYSSTGNHVISNLEESSGKGSILNRIVENITGVIRNLNIRAQELGTYVGLLQTRSDFNRNYATEHLKGADKYTLSDINQEGAYLVALQTRQQLSLNALAVSGRQQNAVLTLFS